MRWRWQGPSWRPFPDPPHPPTGRSTSRWWRRRCSTTRARSSAVSGRRPGWRQRLLGGGGRRAGDRGFSGAPGHPGPAGPIPPPSAVGLVDRWRPAGRLTDGRLITIGGAGMVGAAGRSVGCSRPDDARSKRAEPFSAEVRRPSGFLGERRRLRRRSGRRLIGGARSKRRQPLRQFGRPFGSWRRCSAVMAYPVDDRRGSKRRAVGQSKNLEILRTSSAVSDDPCGGRHDLTDERRRSKIGVAIVLPPI